MSLERFPVSFSSRGNHPPARYQLSIKLVYPGPPCPTGFTLGVGREGWIRRWRAGEAGGWKHTERWDQMMENSRVKEEKQTNTHQPIEQRVAKELLEEHLELFPQYFTRRCSSFPKYIFFCLCLKFLPGLKISGCLTGCPGVSNAHPRTAMNS